jgi:Fur family transcriptional regulator, ferric uptake regulator
MIATIKIDSDFLISFLRSCGRGADTKGLGQILSRSYTLVEASQPSSIDQPRTLGLNRYLFRPFKHSWQVLKSHYMTRPEPMTEEQEVFLKHIQKKGLKRTAQRDLILDVFLRTEEHLSYEDLYRLVKLEDPGVGQTTVYRTLKLLTEAGLAREVRFGDGRTHYEHNYKHQHHDHMICSECGRIIEFFSAELEAIQDAMAAKHRFEVTQHLLRIIGICAECRRARRQKATEEAHLEPKIRHIAGRTR